MNEFFGDVKSQSPEYQRLYRQEGLILDVTEQIWEVMNRQEITRQDLAYRMNCSKSNVTQTLNGSRNMTLRTLSDMAAALECDLTIRLRERGKAEEWRPADSVESGQVFVSDLAPISAANDEWTDLGPRLVNG